MTTTAAFPVLAAAVTLAAPVTTPGTTTSIGGPPPALAHQHVTRPRLRATPATRVGRTRAAVLVGSAQSAPAVRRLAGWR